MKVTFLGTSAARPTIERWLSCVVVQRQGEYFMFDCGEGTQYRLLQEKIRIWHRPASIFISHLHYDHWGGLIGLLASMALEGRSRPLTIYGPPGVQSLFQAIIPLTSKQSFPIKIHDCQPGLIFETQEYCIRACEGSHGIPTLAYAIIECPRPGKFNPDHAKALGVPKGVLWGSLQAGQPVKIDGRLITSEQVVGSSRSGRKIVYAVDTRPNTQIETLATNADLLIHDATFSRIHQNRAEETGHSTAFEAATLAKRAHVRLLILTHISARFRTDEQLLNEAQEVFMSTQVAYDGLTLILPLSS